MNDRISNEPRRLHPQYDDEQAHSESRFDEPRSRAYPQASPPQAASGVSLRLLLIALFVATATTEILHACFR